jgi:ComF family protein
MWTELLQLFYPPLCLLCGRKLIACEQQICLYCHYDLPCAGYHKRPDNPMLRLFAGIPQVRDMAAFLLFEKEGPAQVLTHSFKYRDNKLLAEQMGRIAARAMKADGLFHDVDFLLPVPLHPKKERMRGYNQSEWIARGFASVYQRPICGNILFRTVYAVSQTRKSAYERRLNVENNYALRETETLAGKHVLLIDDVITTGSTVLTCIETLRVIPDIRISVFSLSIVPLQSNADELDMEDEIPEF